MGILKTLTMMQLKDKLNVSFKRDKKAFFFKIILNLIKFGVITALIYVGLFALRFFRLVSYLPIIPQNFMSVLFTCAYLITIIVATVGLVKSLYFSKDNAVLLTLPASKTQIFASKLAVFFIYEFMRNLFFLLPLLFAYGLINSVPIYYYFWLPVALIILTGISVAVASLLSIPAMLIANFVRKQKWLEVSILVILVGLAVTAVVMLIGLIPENLDIIGNWSTTYWSVQKFITAFNKYTIPFYVILEAAIGSQYGVSYHMFYGTQWLYILYSVVGFAIVLALAFFIIKPIYLKIAASPFEFKKTRSWKKRKNRVRPTLISQIHKEILVTFRTPEKLYDLVLSVLALPIAILLLNKIFSAMDTRLAGFNLSITFNVLIIMLIALASNVGFAHVYSEDGAATYLFRTNPKSQSYLLFSKLVLQMILMTCSILSAVIIFTRFVGYTAGKTTIIFFFVEFSYLSHLLWSAEFDIMNPQTEQYKMTGGHIGNPNDIKSSVLALVYAAVSALIVYFLINESSRDVWIKLFFIALILFVSRIVLYFGKIKAYFQERQ